MLAHETAHVAAGEVEREPDPLLSRMRELLADAWAVERLTALGPRNEPVVAARPDPSRSRRFLCVEALRESYGELPPSKSHPISQTSPDGDSACARIGGCGRGPQDDGRRHLGLRSSHAAYPADASENAGLDRARHSCGLVGLRTRDGLIYLLGFD